MRVKYNNQVIECTGIEYKSDTEIEIWTEWGTYTARAKGEMKFSKQVLDEAVINGYCDLDKKQYKLNMVQIGGKPEDAIKKFRKWMESVAVVDDEAGRNQSGAE